MDQGLPSRLQRTPRQDPQHQLDGEDGGEEDVAASGHAAEDMQTCGRGKQGLLAGVWTHSLCMQNLGGAPSQSRCSSGV